MRIHVCCSGAWTRLGIIPKADGPTISASGCRDTLWGCRCVLDWLAQNGNVTCQQLRCHVNLQLVGLSSSLIVSCTAQSGMHGQYHADKELRPLTLGLVRCGMSEVLVCGKQAGVNAAMLTRRRAGAGPWPLV